MLDLNGTGILNQWKICREQIPIGKQRREDIYEITHKLDEEKEKPTR